MTIQDVARRAGVSTATVSRALALPDQVTDATRQSVMSAIRETGYTPNAAARSLRAKSTKMVLVLLPGIGNSFFTPVLNALEEVFSEGGYGVLIGYTRQNRSRETHYARVIRAGQVDGVLVVTGNVPRDEEFVAVPATVPMSLMFSELPGTAQFSVFDVANRTASATMVRYLIEQGHRRIACIPGAEGSLESDERLAGYQEALSAAGLPIDPDLIWRGASNFDFISGERAAARYFALAEKPTAVFAAADEIALGFMRALKNHGIRIPEDVSVVGFDDTEYAVHYDPALTTMRQPRTEMGRLAARDLLRRMEAKGEAVPTSHVRLPCELVIRESVRPLV
ncbi:LacI family DNA-binding transcriptional regulator [Kaistia dalseonensis]|uniref:LacI family repressor for deo operon, udp, cdd, tsx, nupC, and nupG n=1 Tax=Kaistia dalseonensis TaxID=410840 RepID=A0ABU0HFF2_9HYPH|nr:LacI family DNA-binding transcriptional regulator [Kaistia dalseonensis]MCX5497579.1 LacI family DNA-binding transcriptional regulator [Kaistia dalseonensis]MDQ0440219.1 LacI family repressor for deo operon, udp, cdd, tsx, nupC, and nupG [Kaistia dalseonensis]